MFKLSESDRTRLFKLIGGSLLLGVGLYQVWVPAGGEPFSSLLGVFLAYAAGNVGAGIQTPLQPLRNTGRLTGTI